MTGKFLHISCIVREDNVYDVLLALSTLKVGNVETRPVPQTLFLPPPVSKEKLSEKQQKVMATLAAGPKRPSQVAKEINAPLKATNLRLIYLLKKKLVRRVKTGLYALKEAA